MKRLEPIWLLLFFLMMCLSSWYLIQYFAQSQDNKNQYNIICEEAFPESDDSSGKDAQEENERASDFDYQAVLAQNEDCIGWLRLEGTDIDYPVVQGEDNSFYLHHNFQKEYAICGTPFLDYRNNIDALSEHLIIYGHQMKDGSMFKQLNRWKDEAFYQEHQNIILYLREQKYQYEIAAVYITNIARSGPYYDYLHKTTRKQQMEYLKGMAAYQLYDTGISVKESDELLSLSTCEYSSTNGRLTILARRVED